MAKAALLAHGILTAFLIILFGHTFINGQGFPFLFKLFLFFVFALLGFAGLSLYGSFGKSVLFVMYSLYLVSLIGYWFLTKDTYPSLFLVSLVGVGFTLPRKSPSIDTVPETKFVASNKGKYYHQPGSEWAGKIKEENKVWFSSSDEAVAAGYKPHPSLS